jgi:hypothetical protein
MIKNKGLVIKQIHHRRTISRRDDQRPICPAPIEVSIFRVQRNRE